MTAISRHGAETGHTHSEGVTASTGTPTLSSTQKRTGSLAFFFDSGATTQQNLSFNTAFVLGRAYFITAWCYVPTGSIPSVNTSNIIGVTGAASVAAIRFQSDGTLRAAANGVLVGSSSSAVPLDTWFRVDLGFTIDIGAVDAISARLNGSSFCSLTGQTITDTIPTRFILGYTAAAPGASKQIYQDDISVNDNQGSVNTTWAGLEKIYTLFPSADSARGNWTDGNGGTTNIFGSVDNAPPLGEATTGTVVASQIENAVSAAANAYDATMQTYASKGINSYDTVTAIIPLVEIGSSSTTGTDTLTHSVVSNPAIAGTTSSCDIVAGTYPASWNRFTGIISENPSVTVGTAPVMRVAKDIATTRANACTLMAMLVSVLPGVAPTGTRYRSLMMIG
jgi:hypothetical protein